jgi:hypothetical protein
MVRPLDDIIVNVYIVDLLWSVVVNLKQLL